MGQLTEGSNPSLSAITLRMGSFYCREAVDCLGVRKLYARWSDSLKPFGCWSRQRSWRSSSKLGCHRIIYEGGKPIPHSLRPLAHPAVLALARRRDHSSLPARQGWFMPAIHWFHVVDLKPLRPPFGAAHPFIADWQSLVFLSIFPRTALQIH